MKPVEAFGCKLYILNDVTFSKELIDNLLQGSTSIVCKEYGDDVMCFEEGRVIGELDALDVLAVRIEKEQIVVYMCDYQGEDTDAFSMKIDMCSVGEDNVKMFKGNKFQYIPIGNFFKESVHCLDRVSIFDIDSSDGSGIVDEDASDQSIFNDEESGRSEGIEAKEYDEDAISDDEANYRDRKMRQRREEMFGNDSAPSSSLVKSNEHSFRYNTESSKKTCVARKSEQSLAHDLFSIEIDEHLKIMREYCMSHQLRHMVPVMDIVFSTIIRNGDTSKGMVSSVLVGYKKESHYVITSEHASVDEISFLVRDNTVPVVILSQEEAVLYSLNRLCSSKTQTSFSTSERMKHLRVFADHFSIDFNTARNLPRRDMLKILQYFNHEDYPDWLGRIAFYQHRIHIVLTQFFDSIKSNAHSVGRHIPTSIRNNETMTLELISNHCAVTTNLKTLSSKLEHMEKDPLSLIRGRDVSLQLAKKYVESNPKEMMISFSKKLRKRKLGYDEESMAKEYNKFIKTWVAPINQWIFTRTVPTGIAVGVNFEKLEDWISPSFEHQLMLSFGRNITSGTKKIVEFAEMRWSGDKGIRCCQVTFNLFKYGIICEDVEEIETFMRNKKIPIFDLYKSKELNKIVRDFPGSCSIFEDDWKIRAVFDISKDEKKKPIKPLDITKKKKVVPTPSSSSQE